VPVRSAVGNGCNRSAAVATVGQRQLTARSRSTRFPVADRELYREVLEIAFELRIDVVLNQVMPVASAARVLKLGARLLRDFSRERCGTIGTKTRAPGVRH
jgi:hypothetical protein